MSNPLATVPPLREWLQASRTLEIALEGLTDEDLNFRGGPHGWSIRETVHHLVESNLTACTIVIAAVGTGGCTFDCSWLNPDRAWMERMGYRGPVSPALEALSALCRYVGALLGDVPDALGREVKLLGDPATELEPMTVEEMIRQEVKHARHHLKEIDEMLKQRPR